MRFSEDFSPPAPGELHKLDDALWEWRRCSSSKVESKCRLVAEPELPSGVCPVWGFVQRGSEFEEDLSVGFVINPRKTFPARRCHCHLFSQILGI
ncbi:unnamed protein product [Dovyalis caffra]|uniref:Uncharacterized protein n=1 Tax=Dovyalis caffra TaxID=77055 RepID=A0AAV1R0R2_9ROSI|nr:unnamed protein product [Dovyalis caffra]